MTYVETKCITSVSILSTALRDGLKLSDIALQQMPIYVTFFACETHAKPPNRNNDYKSRTKKSLRGEDLT
jgi:hypothetical protein